MSIKWKPDTLSCSGRLATWHSPWFLEVIIPAELSLCLKDSISDSEYFIDPCMGCPSGKLAFDYQEVCFFRFLWIRLLDSLLIHFLIKLTNHRSFQRPSSPRELLAEMAMKIVRLLPLILGHDIPEGDQSWEILMLLKDILELVMSSHFTDELIHVLDCKISEHRGMLRETFLKYKLCPKHHFIEHYPQMIKIFGPLVDVWKIHFSKRWCMTLAISRM